MAAFTQEKGATLHLHTRATTVEHDEAGLVLSVTTEGPDGKSVRPVRGNLISSIPLTLLVQGLRPLPPPEVLAACEKLRFRNTLLVYLMVEGTDLFSDNWIYVHSKDVEAGRITNFRNWSKDLLPPGSTKTPLVCEYWCFDEDALWTTSEEKLIETATQDLEKTGLLKNCPVVKGKVLRIRRCYPVYEMGFRESLDVVVN